MKRARAWILSALFLVGLTPASLAQPYALEWFSLDAGGATSSGGSYTLTGVVGQPDGGQSSGGSMTLVGGLLPGLGELGPPPDRPTLHVQFTGTSIVISWAPALEGFALQQTDSLGLPSWKTAPTGNPVTIAVDTTTRFYRLRKP